MSKYNTKTGVIGLTFKKRKTRCNRCDLPLSTSIWKNRIVVYTVNTKARPDQICIRCVTRESNIDRTFYHSPKQLDNFVGVPIFV